MTLVHIPGALRRCITLLPGPSQRVLPPQIWKLYPDPDHIEEFPDDADVIGSDSSTDEDEDLFMPVEGEGAERGFVTAAPSKLQGMNEQQRLQYLQVCAATPPPPRGLVGTDPGAAQLGPCV